jgi:hypothetical protein
MPNSIEFTSTAGYMDVTILSIFSVAIFLFKSAQLLSCSTESEASMILREGSKLKVIPLLQLFFYSADNDSDEEDEEIILSGLKNL